MSKEPRKIPRELRMPNGDRYVPIVMRILSFHENGMPHELECVPTNDDKFELTRNAEEGIGNHFAVVYGRDATFPGAG